MNEKTQAADDFFVCGLVIEQHSVQCGFWLSRSFLQITPQSGTFTVICSSEDFLAARE